jgi:hypothetical protein
LIVLRKTLALLCGILVAIGTIEVLLRWLPVASDIAELPTSEDLPILRGHPGQEVQFSRGWRFQQSNRTRLNNIGLRGADAVPGAIVVVGDSYIEAAMLDPALTLTGRLGSYLPGKAVFGIGVAGSALSDYLAYARWARREFGAPVAVVNLISDDVIESGLIRSGMSTVVFANGVSRLVHNQFEGASPGNRKILGASALARYLKLNLAVLNQFRLGNLHPKIVVSQNQCQVSDNEASISRLVLAGFDELRRDGMRIVFVLDPARGFDRIGSECQRDIDRYAAEAEKAGFDMVRLEADFAAALARGIALDQRPLDGHWSPAAHDLAARAVAARMTIVRAPESPAARPESFRTNGFSRLGLK